MSATLTCARLCFGVEVEGYSEQLGSGYKWGRSISKGGKGCHLRVSMIDVGTAACSSAHAEPSPTVATATGRKRKWVDLGVIVTKCLTTVATHSGLWVRVICVNIEEACCCLVSFGFSGWMHKCCNNATISVLERLSSLLESLQSFEGVHLLLQMLDYSYFYPLFSWRI